MRMARDEPRLAPAHHRHRRGPPHLHRGARAERLVSDMLGSARASSTWTTLQPSRTRAPCGRLAAVSQLTDLDAFSTEHRRCGDLDAGVDEPVVWIGRECGARIARRADEGD